MKRDSRFYERGYEIAARGRRAAREAMAGLRILQEYLSQYLPVTEDDLLLKQLLDSEIARAISEVRRGILRRRQECGWGDE